MFSSHGTVYAKTVGWLRMKLGFWESLTPKGGFQIETDRRDDRPHRVPEWVVSAASDYFDSYIEKYGQRPYGVTKHFSGNSFVYRVRFESVHRAKAVEYVSRKLKSPRRSRFVARLAPS